MEDSSHEAKPYKYPPEWSEKKIANFERRQQQRKATELLDKEARRLKTKKKNANRARNKAARKARKKNHG